MLVTVEIFLIRTNVGRTKLPGQMSPWQLKTVLNVPRNLPVKFHQNRISNSSHWGRRPSRLKKIHTWYVMFPQNQLTPMVHEPVSSKSGIEGIKRNLNFNPKHGGRGGVVNLTRRFQIFLALLNVYTYRFATSWLFLNIRNKNFEKI